MVALTRASSPDFADELPSAARAAIVELLQRDPKASRKVYVALARKVWSLLVERRLDAEIREWHVLLQHTKAFVRADDNAAAERMSALADLLHHSISLAETSPARSYAERPRARRILDLLQEKGDFLARRVLLDEVGIRGSHLSNILSELVTHGLIERRGVGKEAQFKLTPHGWQLLSGADTISPSPLPATEPERLAERMREPIRQADTAVREWMVTWSNGVGKTTSGLIALHEASLSDMLGASEHPVLRNDNFKLEQLGVTSRTPRPRLPAAAS